MAFNSAGGLRNPSDDIRISIQLVDARTKVRHGVPLFVASRRISLIDHKSPNLQERRWRLAGATVNALTVAQVALAHIPINLFGRGRNVAWRGQIRISSSPETARTKRVAEAMSTLQRISES